MNNSSIKNTTVLALFLSLAVATFSGCVHSPQKLAEKVQVQDSEVFLMTYNLENLFDTQDDPGKNDEEFLPRALKKTTYYQNLCFTRSSEYYQTECIGKDWSESVYRRKISRLADVISRVNDGKGPDILVVEEIENIRALKDLANSMPTLNYKTVVLIEGPDERGIDVGLISRLPAKSSKLHEINFAEIKLGLKKENDILKEQLSKKEERSFVLSEEDTDDMEESFHTRGILEVELELPDKSSLFVLGGHLPSQRASTGYRRMALEKLAQIKATLPKEALVFAAGDFNISASEEAKSKLLAQQAQRDWDVSHLVDCKGCTGTYYYHTKREWSFFDVFLFDKRMTNGTAAWQLEPGSISVFNESLYQINKWGSPAKFGKGMQGVGVSDHWPLVAKIKKNEPQKNVATKEQE